MRQLLITITLVLAVSQSSVPSKPLDRARVLVWVDFGDESWRVLQLIGRQGINFVPSPEYLGLLKDIGASSKILDTLSAAHPQSLAPPPVPGQDAAFAHLSFCMVLVPRRQYADAEKECRAATVEETGNQLLRSRKRVP